MVCAVCRPASAALARRAPTNTTFVVNGDDEDSKVPPVVATNTSAPVETEGWGNRFAHLSEGKWKCNQCFVQNEEGLDKCRSCDAPTPAATDKPSVLGETETATTIPAPPPTGTSQGFGIFGSGLSFAPFPWATTDQAPFPCVTTDQAPSSTSLSPVKTATEGRKRGRNDDSAENHSKRSRR